MAVGTCDLCGSRRRNVHVVAGWFDLSTPAAMCEMCADGARREGDLPYAFPTRAAVSAARRFVRSCGLSPATFVGVDLLGVSDRRYDAACERAWPSLVFAAASDQRDVIDTLCDLLQRPYSDSVAA